MVLSCCYSCLCPLLGVSCQLLGLLSLNVTSSCRLLLVAFEGSAALIPTPPLEGGGRRVRVGPVLEGASESLGGQAGVPPPGTLLAAVTAF